MRSHLQPKVKTMHKEDGKAQPEKNCDVGFIGLGVMGANLTLNLADNGYRVACFDLDQSKVDAILAKEAAERDDDSTPRIE